MKRETAMRSMICSLMIAGLSCSNCNADNRKSTMSASSETWILTGVWWDSPLLEKKPLKTLSIDISISEDIPSSYYCYIAALRGVLNGNDFYAGLLSNIPAVQTKKDPRFRHDVGPGLMFSRWGELSLDAIRPSSGGQYLSSDHEGDHISVRPSFAWRRGRYTLTLAKMDRQSVNGVAHIWVGGFLRVHETNENHFIGALRFSGRELCLNKNVCSFIEIYGSPKTTREIPKFQVQVSNLRINDTSVFGKGLLIYALYPDGVPDIANAELKGEEVVISVGDNFPRRTKRFVPLFDKTGHNYMGSPRVVEVEDDASIGSSKRSAGLGASAGKAIPSQNPDGAGKHKPRIKASDFRPPPNK